MSPRTDGLAITQITVLINGLVDREHQRPSRTQIVTSVRRHLPGASVHLLTRGAVDHDEATLFANITRTHYVDDQEALLEALTAVETKYTLILGNDAVLESDRFLDLWPGRARRDSRYTLFEERIVVLGSSIRAPNRPGAADVRARDRFDFGLTEDLSKLKTLQILNTAPSSHQAEVVSTHWGHLLANNFVLVDAERVGFTVGTAPSRRVPPKAQPFFSRVNGWLGRSTRSS